MVIISVIHYVVQDRVLYLVIKQEGKTLLQERTVQSVTHTVWLMKNSTKLSNFLIRPTRVKIDHRHILMLVSVLVNDDSN